MSSQQKNEFTISGKIIHISKGPEYINEKLSKRIVVLECYMQGYSMYTQEVPFEFINDKMNFLTGINEKDWVTITFTLRGRKTIKEGGKAQWFPQLSGLACSKE